MSIVEKLPLLWQIRIRWLQQHTCPFFDRFIPTGGIEAFKVTNLRGALNEGTTLSTRFWLALFCLFSGARLFVQAPEVLPSAANPWYSIPPTWWATAFTLSGVLILWRVIDSKPRPLCAWVSNLLTTFTCTMAVMSRFYAEGPMSLLGSTTVIMLISAWVLLRTEATYRDGETA